MENDGTRVDYEELLIRYMARVIDIERTAFIESVYAHRIEFTREEEILLTDIEKRAMTRYNI